MLNAPKLSPHHKQKTRKVHGIVQQDTSGAVRSRKRMEKIGNFTFWAFLPTPVELSDLPSSGCPVDLLRFKGDFLAAMHPLDPSRLLW